MPRKYKKKEKKIINYKENSLNDWIHVFLSQFGDVSPGILSVRADTKGWLQNTLCILSGQNRVKISKIRINNYIFRTYHYTEAFKEMLFERAPEIYPQFSTVEKRKVNAESLERATRISDSMCMGIYADLVYDPKQKLSLRKMSGAAKKEEKKEEKNSMEYGRQQTTSPSVWKSNLIQEYNDLSYSVNPNFLPNYNEEIDRKELLKKGVMYASYEMGNALRIDEEDVNHNKFTSITGVLLTDEDAFCLYNAGQGSMTWFTKGENSQATTLGLVLSEIYPQYGPFYKIPNCILFVRDIKYMREIVEGVQKGPALHLPGKGFGRTLAVPIRKEGVALLRTIAKHPNFCDNVAEVFESGKGFEKNYINSRFFPVTNTSDGTPYCMLLDMDLQKIREINDAVEACEVERVSVVCLEWQLEWLKIVLPENTNFVTIKDEAVERIVDRHQNNKGNI
ncbi:hypothetical protein [Macellibacteroides fermentans]|uniref:hypothetical protein n=1 Tax=Macellibacteroides fermentans TaxID=879969 RepID=UPI00406D1C1A